MSVKRRDLVRYNADVFHLKSIRDSGWKQFWKQLNAVINAFSEINRIVNISVIILLRKGKHMVLLDRLVDCTSAFPI